MNHELEELAQHLKPNQKLITTTEIKKKSKAPPYITVGNGVSTKNFSEEVVKDAFKVLSQLSKAQQALFVDLKDILVQQQMANYYSKRKVKNPNLITLESSKINEEHKKIRTKMSQNRNRQTLEKHGVLKQLKPGQYMLNPYIFIPSNDFEDVVKQWESMSTKS